MRQCAVRAAKFSVPAALRAKARAAHAPEGRPLSGGLRGRPGGAAGSDAAAHPQCAGIRRGVHRAMLRFSRRRGLLRAVKRGPAARGDSPPGADRGGAGRSLRANLVLRNSGAASQSATFVRRHAPWRPLRLYLARARRRAILGGSRHRALLPSGLGRSALIALARVRDTENKQRRTSLFDSEGVRWIYTHRTQDWNPRSDNRQKEKAGDCDEHGPQVKWSNLEEKRLQNAGKSERENQTRY